MNVGLIGAGHIARALAEGWSRPDVPGPPSLIFFDVDAAKARELAAATGGGAAATAAEFVAQADLVIVAVRPQHVEGVLQDIGAALGKRPVVSVAAGVTLARLQAALPTGTRVARVMPKRPGHEHEQSLAESRGDVGHDAGDALSLIHI